MLEITDRQPRLHPTVSGGAESKVAGRAVVPTVQRRSCGCAPLVVCLERNTGTGAVSADVLRRMHETYQRRTEPEGRIIVLGLDTDI
jgi:hypothetical protein